MIKRTTNDWSGICGALRSINAANNIKLTIKRLFEIISFNRLIYFYGKQFIEAAWSKTKTPKQKRMMRAAGWF
ncbi:MAG: hypothetical protein ACXWE4_00520 [Methylobacter sp.]